MATRTILAAVSGGSASAGVIEIACRLAHRFESHLEIYHARPDPSDMMLPPTDGFTTATSADLITTTIEEAARVAMAARALYAAAVERHGLPRQDRPTPDRKASASRREGTGYAAVTLAQRAAVRPSHSRSVHRRGGKPVCHGSGRGRSHGAWR